MPTSQDGALTQAVSHPARPFAAAPAWGSRKIRPLRVILLNGAEDKSDGDLRIARLLGNTALQVELTILRDQHAAERDISPHLLHFYRTFAEVQARSYDALVVVGNDPEHGRRSGSGRDGELEAVIAWSCLQGHAGLFLGAAAFAALNLLYGVGARRLPARRIGVVRHRLVALSEPLLRGHDRFVRVPVVDGGGLERGDLPPGGPLASLVESADAGIHILSDAARRLTFVLNDISADAGAIAPRLGDGSGDRVPGLGSSERRDQRGWRAHAQLLFANWLAVEVGQVPAATTLAHAHARHSGVRLHGAPAAGCPG
jgi:homoserine O-succinyltransferase